MPEPTQDPWTVDETQFPATGSPAEQLRFALNYAVLAPSGHNTQPWRFKISGDAAEVWADRTRALPVVDPEDRELAISCGAALFHLRIALRHYGFAAATETLPDANVPDLLARVHLGGRRSATPDGQMLFRAITRRRTHRMSFEDREVPGSQLMELQAAAEEEGAWLHVVRGEPARHAVADLIAEGDHRQWADPRFRHELAAWVHPNRSSSRDGMPGYTFGMGDLASCVGPFILRTFDLGRGVAARDRQIAEGSPVLAALGADGDAAAEWLAAGQALARVLLRACVEGVSASFLNQPIEVPELRPRLRALIGRPGFPQLLLRMGYGPEVKPTPRRPVSEVLLAG
ncbi:MAG: nitroreductase [Armatimonadetes bacterium]|nr:nitroreductase [Armatimonadota bacterium]